MTVSLPNKQKTTTTTANSAIIKKIYQEIKKELGDKFEILIAMANFYGFTLEDIINEAKIKKSKNGGFEKRLLLEKVIQNRKW